MAARRNEGEGESRTAAGNVAPRPRPPGPRSRSEKAREHRGAIAEAALQVFSEQGYAATRMEDVARRAGVAKGTIYLHFKDKGALFEEIVRTVLVLPIRDVARDGPGADETVRDFLERRFVPLLDEIGGSRRGDVVRLMIAEGGRFPELARSYHREVIETGMALIANLARRARARGEIHHDALERFPQLLVAPALLGLLWRSLFERIQPLDVQGMIRAELDLAFGPASGRPSGP